MDAKQEVLLDTCVLINFATIGRMDLLASHPQYVFLITDHVRDEVKAHFTGQYESVNAAVADGTLVELTVDTPAEFEDFAKLVALKTLGEGECSAIAVAKNRSMLLAIDDRRARNKAQAFYSQLQLLGTEELMVSLIDTGILTVEQADNIKRDWETNHRFKLSFSSFADKIV
jgi:hypothetical protein